MCFVIIGYDVIIWEKSHPSLYSLQWVNWMPEGYAANRLTMSHEEYMLQVSDGEDPKL